MTISQQELEKFLWDAAIILRGVIDASEYKNIIFPLMFYKRLSDVYDEEYQEALSIYEDPESARYVENHVFQVPEGSHWNEVRKVTTNVGLALRTAMIEIEKANSNGLLGIFGDTNWTNKDRLSDSILIDLIEHFSSISLTLKNVPQDEFGNAYEYLIKKFADDSGHSAAEFYTNRTVVRLMTQFMDPHSGESIYDPTCGSGGMLINSLLLVKERGRESRSLKLYGQEINIMTSSIARMNMFIHGVQDFEIIQGDTLRRPAFIENERIKQFDICLANPPYSMKKWDRELWKQDPWGRNIYGTPPQGNADYAFFQHIICSLKKDTGRCALLWPHGILFRDAEKEIRSKLIEDDYIDCVIGLGKNLFYNSVMESCIVICRMTKPLQRKKKILFINGLNEIIEVKNMAFLSDSNIINLHRLYVDYKNVPGLSYVASLEEIRKKDYNLNIPFYLQKWHLGDSEEEIITLSNTWQNNSINIRKNFDELRNLVERVLN